MSNNDIFVLIIHQLAHGYGEQRMSGVINTKFKRVELIENDFSISLELIYLN